MFLGLTHPSDLISCKSGPQDFLLKVDQYGVLQPDQADSQQVAFLNLLEFVALTQSDMACLLRFSGDFIEVARVKWLLDRVFSALQLRLSNCVEFD